MVEPQRFVGMENYYHRFLPQAVKVMVPLAKILNVDPRGKSQSIPWDEQALAAL